MPLGTRPPPGCDTANAAEPEAEQLKGHESCVMFHEPSARPSAGNIGKKIMLYLIVAFQSKSLHVPFAI